MKFFSASARPSRAPDRGVAEIGGVPSRALLRRLEVSARKELAGALAGEFRSRLRGRGMEFAGLRPYLPGDEVRLIDWNVTARSGTPHVRLYQEERSRTLTLLADLSPSLTPPKRSLLLQIAALLAFAAVHSRDRLALVAFSDRIEQVVPPGTGRQHALRILSDLARLRPAGHGTDLAPALQMALALNRRPGLLLLLGDGHVDLPEALLRRAAGRHDLLALLLRDPAETDPQQRGLLQLRDLESGAERLVDLSSSGAREAVAAAWAKSDATLAARLQGFGIDHAFLPCGTPPLPALLRLFRQRSRSR